MKHVNRKKLLTCLVLLIAVVCCVSVCTSFVSADVGNSFSGGGSSSSSGSHGSSGGSGLFALLLTGGPSDIIVLLIVFGILYYASKHKPEPKFVPTSDFKTAYFNENEVVNQIQKIDPNFSTEQFKTFVSESYLTLQEAWEKRSWSIVRPIETNVLFQVHQRQLQEYIDQGLTDHLDRQNIRSVGIASFKQEGGFDVVVVKLDASLLDYVTRDSDGKIIEGSDTVFQNRSYRLEFVRTSGVMTQAIEESDTGAHNCPNCGAPIEVSAAGECAYCHTVITTGEFGWVLNKFAAW